jgi:DNA adenine methylase
MSINDVPQIREAFAAFQMVEVATTYSVAAQSSGAADRAELLISNFDLKGA